MSTIQLILAVGMPLRLCCITRLSADDHDDLTLHAYNQPQLFTNPCFECSMTTLSNAMGLEAYLGSIENMQATSLPKDAYVDLQVHARVFGKGKHVPLGALSKKGM